MVIDYSTPDFEIIKNLSKKLSKISPRHETEFDDLIKKLDTEEDIFKKIVLIEDAIEQLPESSPLYFLVLLLKVHEYQKLEKYDDAIQYMKNILEKLNLPMHDSVTPFTKSICYFSFGVLLHHKKKFDESRKYLDKAIEIEPENLLAWNLKIINCNSTGDYKEGVHCCEKILPIMKSWSNDPILKNGISNESEIWTSKARFFNGLDQNQDALECCTHAIKIDKQNAKAWLEKSKILFELEEYNESLECCTHAIKIDKQNAKAWLEKSKILFELEEYKESLECCNTSLDLDGNNVESFAHKLSCLMWLGKFDEMLECIGEALNMIENSTSIYSEVKMLAKQPLYIHKLTALECLNRHKEAIKCADMLLDVHKKLKGLDEEYYEYVFRIAWETKSRCYYGLDEYKKALECIDVALSLKTNLPSHLLLVTKAEILSSLERYTDSIAYYKKALSIEENEKTRKSLDEVIEKQNKLQKEDVGDEANNNEKPQWTNDPATDAQRQYIKKLGGNENDPKTKGEASEMIARLKEEN